MTKILYIVFSFFFPPNNFLFQVLGLDFPFHQVLSFALGSLTKEEEWPMESIWLDLQWGAYVFLSLCKC